MTRSFLILLLGIAACGNGYDDVSVGPPPPRLVEIALGGSGDRLTFLLPDAEWHAVGTDGLRYGRGSRELRVTVCLKESGFGPAVAAARAGSQGAEIKAFEVMPVWPFVGVIIAYRGEPDAHMLDAFALSFKVERR